MLCRVAVVIDVVAVVVAMCVRTYMCALMWVYVTAQLRKVNTLQFKIVFKNVVLPEYISFPSFDDLWCRIALLGPQIGGGESNTNVLPLSTDLGSGSWSGFYICLLSVNKKTVYSGS
jgi:hypothetical protein